MASSYLRKMASMVFEDIVSQDHITQTLKNQILNDKISHAYYSAERAEQVKPSGKGFKRAVNCLNPHDGSPCNECEVCKVFWTAVFWTLKKLTRRQTTVSTIFPKFVTMCVMFPQTQNTQFTS